MDVCAFCDTPRNKHFEKEHSFVSKKDSLEFFETLANMFDILTNPEKIERMLADSKIPFMAPTNNKSLLN